MVVLGGGAISYERGTPVANASQCWLTSAWCERSGLTTCAIYERFWNGLFFPRRAYPRPRVPAKREQLEGVEDFYLKAKARIWP